MHLGGWSIEGELCSVVDVEADGRSLATRIGFSVVGLEISGDLV